MKKYLKNMHWANSKGKLDTKEITIDAVVIMALCIIIITIHKAVL